MTDFTDFALQTWFEQMQYFTCHTLLCFSSPVKSLRDKAAAQVIITMHFYKFLIRDKLVPVGGCVAGGTTRGVLYLNSASTGSTTLATGHCKKVLFKPLPL